MLTMGRTAYRNEEYEKKLRYGLSSQEESGMRRFEKEKILRERIRESIRRESTRRIYKVSKLIKYID